MGEGSSRANPLAGRPGRGRAPRGSEYWRKVNARRRGKVV
jgi:hypothetical protein